MKKKFLRIIFVVFIVFFLSFFMRLLKTHHFIQYQISSFSIQEEYSKNYHFILENKKQKYSFYVPNYFSKKKKVLKSIQKYKQDNITCVLPIYLSNRIEKPVCLEENSQVSLAYLRQNRFSELQKIYQKMKKDGYVLSLPNNKKDIYTIDQNVKLYQSNIPDRMIITMWRYTGLSTFSKKNSRQITLLKGEEYEAKYNYLFHQYYLLFDFSDEIQQDKMIYYDIVKNKKRTFQLAPKIDYDSYINGSYQNKIYVTDNDKKKQFRISLFDDEMDEMDGLYFYEKDQFKMMGTNQFLKEKRIFQRHLHNSYGKDLTYENGYYYKIQDGNFYRIDSKYSSSEILFHFPSISTYQVHGESILFVVDNTLYLYSDSTFIKKILEYNELRYNYENICDFYQS